MPSSVGLRHSAAGTWLNLRSQAQAAPFSPVLATLSRFLHSTPDLPKLTHNSAESQRHLGASSAGMAFSSRTAESAGVPFPAGNIEPLTSSINPLDHPVAKITDQSHPHPHTPVHVPPCPATTHAPATPMRTIPFQHRRGGCNAPSRATLIHVVINALRETGLFRPRPSGLFQLASAEKWR